MSVDANLFENGAKQLRFRLKTNYCGRSLNSLFTAPLESRPLFYNYFRVPHPCFSRPKIYIPVDLIQVGFSMQGFGS